MSDSGRSKALAETVLCCRTTFHWFRSGRNRAWKLGLKPRTTICGCYLPLTDPRGSCILPCGVAYISCQTNEGPQSWTEHLGSAVAASTSPHWTVPAWWSLELGSIILAGGFWMLKQTLHFCAHSLSRKGAQLPIQSSRIGPLDLKIISLFRLTRFVLWLFLSFYFEYHFCVLLTLIG